MIHKAITSNNIINSNSVIAKKITKKIGNIDNNFLISGAAVPSLFSSFMKLKVKNNTSFVDGIRTRKLSSAIRQGKYDQVSNSFDAGYPVVEVAVFNTDDATLLSVNNKGKIVYTIHSGSIVSNL